MQSKPFIESSALPWEDLGGGVRRQILGYDETVMLLRVRFEAGAVGEPHSHPHRQSSLVDEVQIGGEARVLRAGDAFFVPPNVVHSVVALEAGVLVDAFAPAREDFLPGDAP